MIALLALSLVLALPARAAVVVPLEIAGAGFGGHSPAALGSASQDFLQVLPADGVVGCALLGELRQMRSAPGASSVHQAALTLVLGALSQEPSAAAPLAAAGLPVETVARLADAAQRTAAAAAADPALAAELAVVRQDVAASVAKSAAGETTLARAGAPALEELQRLARASANETIEPAPEPVKGTADSIRYTTWKTRLRADMDAGKHAIADLDRASKELPAPELVRLTRYFMDATLGPASEISLPSREAADARIFGARVLASLYAEHGWGASAVQKQLFREFIEAVSSRVEPGLATTHQSWKTWYEGFGEASHKASAAAAAVIASAIRQQPELAAETATFDYLLRARSALLASLFSYSGNGDSTTRKMREQLDAPLISVTKALESVAEAGVGDFSYELFVQLEAEMERLALDDGVSTEIKFAATKLLAALAARAPRVPDYAAPTALPAAATPQTELAPAREAAPRSETPDPIVLARLEKLGKYGRVLAVLLGLVGFAGGLDLHEMTLPVKALFSSVAVLYLFSEITIRNSARWREETAAATAAPVRLTRRERLGSRGKTLAVLSGLLGIVGVLMNWLSNAAAVHVILAAAVFFFISRWAVLSGARRRQEAAAALETAAAATLTDPGDQAGLEELEREGITASDDERWARIEAELAVRTRVGTDAANPQAEGESLADVPDVAALKERRADAAR